MYLAQERQRDGTHKFFIRHSYQDGEGAWLTKDVFDLGHDPEQFIIYVGLHGFYFAPEIEEAVTGNGIDYKDEELENILWPFIDPDIRRTIENFGGRRARNKPRRRRKSDTELSEMQKAIHAFDKRRIAFLRFVQTNLERIVGSPLPIYNCLLNKSRDEIEQMIHFMELDLRSFEMKGYLYAIFDLPSRFYPRRSRFIPDQQDPDLLDQYFLEELCRLNQDPFYLDKGIRPNAFHGLHPYLQKYLSLYFDIYFRDAPRQNSRQASWASPRNAARDQKYYDIMGLSLEEFSAMSEEEFKSHYRRKALELHPDHGGSNEAFIALKEAYQILMYRKRW